MKDSAINTRAGGRGIPPAGDRKVLFVEKMGLFSFLLATLVFRGFRVMYVLQSGLMGRCMPFVRSFSGRDRDNFYQLDYADFPGSFYQTMEESTQRVNDSVWNQYPENLYVRLATTFCSDPLLPVAIQKEVLNRYVVKRVKTYVLLKHLTRIHPRVTFLPVDNEPIGSAMSPGLQVSSQGMVPGWYKKFNALSETSRNLLFFLALPFILSGILLVTLKRGISVIRPEIRHFDLGYDVFGLGILGDRGYDTETGSYFLYNESDFHPSRILHMVRPGHRLEPGARALFEKMGAPYTELDSLKIPLPYLMQKMFREFFLGTLRNMLRFTGSSDRRCLFTIPALASMKMILDAGVHYQHFEVGVFIARDDYSSFHIARTIVAHQHSCHTIGFQWADYYNHNSSFSHFVFDKYGLWGDFYRDFHSRGLSYSSTGIIGANMYSSDTMYNLSRKKYLNPAYEEIRKRFTIVAIMGSAFEPESSITKGPAIRFHRDVLDATEKYKGVLRVFKPKGDYLDAEIKELMEGRERVRLEKDLPTARFLLIPDLIIIQSVSSLGIEALMARRRILSYSFSTPPEYQIYARYSPHLVAFTREELERSLDRILLEDRYVEEGILEEIRVHHGYRFDGQVTERFRQMCRDLLKSG